jgi:hypothetical protein
MGKEMCGKPMPVFGALIGLKGDWEWEKEFLQQGRGWKSTLICTCCNASWDDLHPYQDHDCCCSKPVMLPS